jgi:hypothetical protein
VGNFQTEDQMKANPIIILEDNLAQELLFEQFITDIAVDGANNNGLALPILVCFVSPNGQETKYHFTINNSPLPSVINDVAINNHRRSFYCYFKDWYLFKGLQQQQMMI